MGVKCTFSMAPGDETLEYEGPDGATYEQALLSLEIIPDTVLILFRGVSLPQDKPIEEDNVEILSTCSRG